jgi:hypothetical protein
MAVKYTVSERGKSAATPATKEMVRQRKSIGDTTLRALKKVYTIYGERIIR